MTAPIPSTCEQYPLLANSVRSQEPARCANWFVLGARTNLKKETFKLMYTLSGRASRSLLPSRQVIHARGLIRPVTYNSKPECSGDVASRFGLRLRELRCQRNLTQMQMALRFGIDRSYISEVECGKKSISLGILEVIAMGFQMTLSEVMKDI